MGYLVLLVGGWALYKLNGKYRWIKVGAQQAQVINLDNNLPAKEAEQVKYLLANIQDPNILKAAAQSFGQYPIAASMLAQKALGH